jgi:hypothetical protein
MPISRREVQSVKSFWLVCLSKNGRIWIECPRLMTDLELADVLADFVDQVRARPPKPSQSIPPQPSTLPAFRKRKSR